MAYRSLRIKERKLKAKEPELIPNHGHREFYSRHTWRTSGLKETDMGNSGPIWKREIKLITRVENNNMGGKSDGVSKLVCVP